MLQDQTPTNSQDEKVLISTLDALPPTSISDQPVTDRPDTDELAIEDLQPRPWGTVAVLEEGPGYKINRIEVTPGHQLSLQMHHHRSEHWIVVSGTAKAICGDQEILLCANQSTYVAACTTHRLCNAGVIPLVVIEVQNGEYLGEDDIIRFQNEGKFENFG
ncbi:MAG: phosphomannose isomerase type II C-terminal cupin domain [Cyanobacteria bacterium P01_F01_bin.4]